MNKNALRGFTNSPERHVEPEAPWDSLNISEKVKKCLGLMTKPGFVKKRGRVDGTDALLLKIEKESELAAAIVATPEGREAAIRFIEDLYRSEDSGASANRARKALELLSFDMSPEEKTKIRNAELDCRAYVIATDPYAHSSWLDGLTVDERLEVDRRAEIYRTKI